MNHFKPIVDLLNERFPKLFSCKSGKAGEADGLEVRCSDRSGHAFVYEPDQNGGFLLSLPESNDDDDGEVWSTSGAAEVVKRLEPWAFPPRRRAPQAVELTEE